MQATVKPIAIVVVGAGADTAELKEIDLHPGVTVREALQQVGLQGYRLSKGKGKPFLDSDANMYALVEEPGEKFFASTPADQG